MESNNKNKHLSVSERMKASEKLGAEVAKIMNKARAKANKLLLPTGHGININVDFYKLEDDQPAETKEVTSG